MLIIVCYLTPNAAKIFQANCINYSVQLINFREMYESVVNTVKECSDEMRGSIKMFQQNMEQMSDVSHEKFSAMTNSGQF